MFSMIKDQIVRASSGCLVLRLLSFDRPEIRVPKPVKDTRGRVRKAREKVWGECWRLFRHAVG